MVGSKSSLDNAGDVGVLGVPSRKLRATTAQESTQKAANISKYFFRTPPIYKLLIPIVCTSALWGLLLSLGEGELSIQEITRTSVLLFLFPALLSIFLATPLDMALGGKLYFRRSAFLSFLSLLCLGPVLALLYLLKDPLKMDVWVVLVFSYAFIIWIRHLFIVSISNSKHLKSTAPTILQSLFGFVAVHHLFPSTIENMDYLVGALFSLIFFLTIIWFLEIITSPLRADFKANLWENLGNALAHIIERGDVGVRELESFFSAFSENMDIFMGVVGFRKKGDINTSDPGGQNELKAMMVIPSIHPGPFGVIGGGDLTAKLGRELKGVSENIFLFHGPATHDINLATTSEVGKVATTVRSFLEKMEYDEVASHLVRYHDEFDILTQYFGENALNMYTSSPEPSDDIDYSTGYMAVMRAKLFGARESILVDSHNCLKPGAGGVYFGKERSFKMLDYIGESMKMAQKKMVHDVRVGTAQDTSFRLSQGLAGAGIQALVVETGGQKAAYILFDGNNMVQGLREDIIANMSGLVDECEVFTSDNHAVNVNFGGYNPVGLLARRNDVLKKTRIVVKKAIADLESVEVGMKTGFIRGLKVFGVENTARLTTIINSSTSILVKSALATITIAVLGCGLVVTFLP